MDRLIIQGKNNLVGKINIDKSEKSTILLLIASILCSEKIIIEKPLVGKKVTNLIDFISKLSSHIKIDHIKNVMMIENKYINYSDFLDEKFRQMRESIILVGPMVGKFGRCEIPLPGGCVFGPSSIDMHLTSLIRLGANCEISNGCINVTATKLKGNTICLPFPSVSVTATILMAATLAEGITTIECASTDPIIVNLANFINQMGGNITKAGYNTIIVEGVKVLHGATFTPLFDIFEAGTFMIAAAITRSAFQINGINKEHLLSIISVLEKCNILIDSYGDNIIINGNRDLKPTNLHTAYYPGFPSDLQAHMMALLCTVKGTSSITEDIYPNRFMHVSEFWKMGAKIVVEGPVATITGGTIKGSYVKATDHSGGVALELLALCGDGLTIIDGVNYNYLNRINKLIGLGANIKMENI